jgi:cystathionine beta-synthase
VIGEVVGALNERALLEHVFSGAAKMNDAVSEFIGAPLGLIGVHESVTAARTALSLTDAVLVIDDGKPVGVLTRHDLLSFLSE